MYKKILITTACLLALSACGKTETKITVNQSENIEAIAKTADAPLFEGMGSFHRAITTASPDAQKYFDQGMVLAFGFNHAESIRSFKAAQKFDPTCAMCFWGEALATGPNINVISNGNAVMSDAGRSAAFLAINNAIELKGSASPREKALIEALATRYNGDLSTDREPARHRLC